MKSAAAFAPLLYLVLAGCTITVHVDDDVGRPVMKTPKAEAPDVWEIQTSETYVDDSNPAAQITRLARSHWTVTERYYDGNGYVKLKCTREFNPGLNKTRRIRGEVP